MDYYQEFVLRNGGYVPAELQAKIRKTRLLIAGCGIGSTIAEAAVRLGFEHLSLVDGDVIEAHNLNRQSYDHADIALGARLKRINPHVTLTERPEFITPANAKACVEASDVVFDTIDFLDINAITAVHDEAHRQGKPVISAVSAGWGAVALYFPRSEHPVTSFRRIFNLPETGAVQNESYVKHFAPLIERLKSRLDPKVAEAMAKALTVMEDGTPCPAPHVSAGAYAVASLSVTLMARVLHGEPVAEAPRLIVVNMGEMGESHTLDLEAA
jgi:molybdopterin/thiamine biosynthesis adenylyltransferase